MSRVTMPIAARRATRPTLLDALSEVEEARGVVGVLDAPQPRVVRAVVGALPAAKLGVDVVHVGLPGHVRTERRVEVAHPGEVRGRSGCVAGGPVCEVLGGAERISVD